MIQSVSNSLTVLYPQMGQHFKKIKLEQSKTNTCSLRAKSIFVGKERKGINAKKKVPIGRVAASTRRAKGYESEIATTQSVNMHDWPTRECNVMQNGIF